MADAKPNPVLGFIKKVFPFISAASQLGGPPAVLAAGLVGKALGFDKTTPPTTVDPTLAGITAAVAGATPEQLVSLQQAELDFQEKMKQLGFQHVEEMESLFVQDRASARDMAIKTGDKWTPRVLAFVITAGFFGTLGLMMKYSLPSATHDALLLLLGSLTTAWVAVVTYYFGSSAGSAAKTAMLQNGNGNGNGK